MKKYQKLYQLKQFVKANAEYYKYVRLTAKLNHDPSFDEKLKTLRPTMMCDSRILHIAYSLLKGKSYQQIENSVKTGNELEKYEWKSIVDIMNQYKDEENSCVIPTEPFPTTKVNLPKVKKVEA